MIDPDTYEECRRLKVEIEALRARVVELTKQVKTLNERTAGLVRMGGGFFDD